VLEGVLMRPDEHGVQLRVEQLDRLDRGLDEFGGRDVPVADQPGLGGRVQPGEFGEIDQGSPPHRSVRACGRPVRNREASVVEPHLT
jgi:hypothetical protein